MKAEITDAFLLKEEEFHFLMSVRGHRWYVGDPVKNAALSRQESLNCLYGLVKKGYVICTGEHFRVEERMAACIDGVGQAEKVLCVERADGRIPVCFLYLKEKATVYQRQPLKAEMLKLWQLPVQDWTCMLIEDGFFEEKWEIPSPKMTKEGVLRREICLVRKYSNRKENLGSFCWMKERDTFMARITENGVCREISSDTNGLPELLGQWARKGGESGDSCGYMGTCTGQEL